MGGEELLIMWIWLLALVVRLLGPRGKHWLGEAESATAHCMARLYLSGAGEIWQTLSFEEWDHSASIRPIKNLLPPLERSQGPDFAPGFNRLACWQVWVGPPFHTLPSDRQLAIAAYFEDAQARFYRALACLSWGVDRQTYLQIAAHEQGHAAMLPFLCSECRRKEGKAIAALIFLDLPCILSGRFTYFLGKSDK